MFVCVCRVRFLYLCVVVKVPQVKVAHSVHARKQGGVDGGPHDVVNIVRVVLKGVQRLVILQARKGKEPLTSFHRTVTSPEHINTNIHTHSRADKKTAHTHEVNIPTQTERDKCNNRERESERAGHGSITNGCVGLLY